MKQYRILYSILFVFFSREVIFSQSNCNKKKLPGTWLCIDAYIYSTDSLTTEKVELLLNNSAKDKGWSWTFDTTGNRITTPENKLVNYILDEKNCTIIYGRPKKPTRLNTIKILYIDHEYLILEIPNRHSQTISAFRKFP